jgi:ATP-dependent helicase/nuclease subunit B
MPDIHSVLSSELIAAIESGACVLTPNQRSAHWLKLLYANYALAQGRNAWATPDIQSFNAFVAQLWRTQGSGTERVLSPEQSQLVWGQIVARSARSESLLSPQAAATTSFRAWERMQAWRIGRDELAEHATATDSNEAQALLEWSDAFESLCKQRSWLPAANLPQRQANAPSAIRIAHVVTMADDMPPGNRALLEHLEHQGTRWQKLTAQSAAGQVSVAACDSYELELHFAAAWAREQLHTGTRSIGIVVPELDAQATQVRRIFAEVFAQSTRTFILNTAAGFERTQQEASFTLASYHRLADFPVVRAALDLLQLMMGRASSTLAGAILRNPFLAASRNEASQRALADARLRSEVREHYDCASLQRLTTVTGCSVLSQRLHDASLLRHVQPASALPSAMAEHFIQLWRAFGWPGEQSPDSDEQQIVARLQACLGEFGALDELLGPLTFAAAVNEFEQLTRSVSFEPRSVPAAITIVDINAVDGLQFDALWVAGMNEARWPPPAAPDPFIPIALQLRAGLPMASAKLAREHARHRFEDLQRIARSVVFSWARQEQDVELLPSPWLQDLPQAVLATPATTYASTIFAIKPALETITESAAPALPTQVGIAATRGGARIFELQSLCPFRAFAELRLAARPLDQVAPNVDASERGTLIHAALADVWQTLGGSEGLRAHSAEQLEVLVRTSLARYAAKLMNGASPHRVRMLQIEQDLATERMLALFELDRQRATFRVVGRPETSEHVTVGTLQFELRLDRMDELLDEASRGLRVIVDYKTGNNVSTHSWLSARPEQPQLPLYAVTHSEQLGAVAFATLGAKGVTYQGVAREEGLLPSIKAFNDKHLPLPHTGWNGLLDYWHTVIARLANEFASGNAAVDPLPTACRYCHLSTLCRVHEQTEHQHEDSEEGA